jgi:hypothetical protein
MALQFSLNSLTRVKGHQWNVEIEVPYFGKHTVVAEGKTPNDAVKEAFTQIRSMLREASEASMYQQEFEPADPTRP